MTYPDFEGPTTDPVSTFPAPEPVSFDVPADDEQNSPEVEETATGQSPKKAPRRKAPARTARLAPAQVRRVLAQKDLIEEQDENVLDILAAVLGTTADDTTELVVATLTATKAPAEAISELENLAGLTNPYEKVVAAIGVAADRENARRVWGLLTALGKVDGAIPAKETQAGAKIAEAVDALDLADLAAFDTITNLLGA